MLSKQYNKFEPKYYPTPIYPKSFGNLNDFIGKILYHFRSQETLYAYLKRYNLNLNDFKTYNEFITYLDNNEYYHLDLEKINPNWFKIFRKYEFDITKQEIIRLVKKGGHFDKHYFTLSGLELQIKNYIKYIWKPSLDLEFFHHGDNIITELGNMTVYRKKEDFSEENIITEVEDTGEFIIETQKLIKK